MGGCVCWLFIVYLYDVFDIVCCSTCSFLFAYFAWARAIIYSIIYMEAFKKNDIFLFILLFREVGLNECKDCMYLWRLWSKTRQSGEILALAPWCVWLRFTTKNAPSVYPPLGGVLFLAGNPYMIFDVYITISSGRNKYLKISESRQMCRASQTLLRSRKDVSQILAPLNPKSLPP